MSVSDLVLMSRSPLGVAPPVSDDCAPIGSTRRADCTSAETSAADFGKAMPVATPPGTCAASLRNDCSTSTLRSTAGGAAVGAGETRIRCVGEASCARCQGAA